MRLSKGVVLVGKALDDGFLFNHDDLARADIMLDKKRIPQVTCTDF